MVAAKESQDARLARIEEKLDGLDKRLNERCTGNVGRIEALEKSVHKLEAAEHRRHGGMAVMTALWAVAGVIGGLAAKILPLGGR